MLAESTLRLVFGQFKEAGLLRGARFLSEGDLKLMRPRQIRFALRGRVEVAGREVELTVGADARFPLSLPIVVLAPADALGRIPHVMDDGFVCYGVPEVLVLDGRNPLGILLDALDLARAVLEEGASGANQFDFLQEFAVYWSHLCSGRRAVSLIRADDILRPILAHTGQRAPGVLLVTEMEENNGSSRHRALVPEMPTVLSERRGLYVPLRSDAFVLPPRIASPWTFDEARQLVRANLSEENAKRLKEQGPRHHRNEFVVLGIPRPDGDRTLVGLQYQEVLRGHPLVDGRSTKPPLPVAIDRRDASYLLCRGGADDTLGQAKVLLVGCGSVGGFLALALARSGIGRLSLVDGEKLEPQNIFRHVLGRSALGRGKAAALQAEIGAKYPFVQVATHEGRIEDLLSRRQLDLSSFDAVVLALGSPTIELHLNKLFHECQTHGFAVFTWLEPYGIGGHALLTRPGKKGCFQCLYTDTRGADACCSNRAAFAAPDQMFSLNDLGCGTGYTPYGALEAEKTANLAARLVLDALRGREPASPLLSWQGSADDFRAAGFAVSPRYFSSDEDLDQQRYSYAVASCPVCGAGVP